MSLATKYRKSLDETWQIRLKTLHPDKDSIDGVVTAIQPGFIVLREEFEFAFDGVVVLPKRVVTGYRDGKFERAGNAVLRHAGATRKARSPIWLNQCEDLTQVLYELKQRDIWPGLEILFEDEDEELASAFYVGPVAYVDGDTFGLQCYDAEGNWEDVYDLEISEIFKISVDDQYTKTFNKWMREAGPARPI